MKSNNLSAGNVLIVGAGVSGLSAARELKKAGFSVLLLEGRERPGGRIWTDHSLSVPVDLGAAWIHGKGRNPIFDICRKNKIETAVTDYSNSCLLDESGKESEFWEKMAFSKRSDRIMPRLARLRRGLDKDISLAEAVELLASRSRIGKGEMPFFNRQLIELEAYNGADLSELSLFHIVEAAESRHGADLMFPNGYSQVVESLAEGLEIRYEEIVETVSYDQSNVTIRTNKGIHSADAALITLPLGVLKSGAVKFSPQLPNNKLDAISSIKLGLFNKVAMRFRDPFWQTEADFIELIPKERKLCLQFLSLHKYTNEPVLIALLAASTARQWEEFTYEEMRVKMLDTLTQLYGDKVEEPTHFKITRWGKDKFTLGSYSIVNLGVEKKHFDALAEPVSRLFFAGEATTYSQQGSVPGAYSSGIRAARQIFSIAKVSVGTRRKLFFR